MYVCIPCVSCLPAETRRWHPVLWNYHMGAGTMLRSLTNSPTLGVFTVVHQCHRSWHGGSADSVFQPGNLSLGSQAHMVEGGNQLLKVVFVFWPHTCMPWFTNTQINKFKKMIKSYVETKNQIFFRNSKIIESFSKRNISLILYNV